MSSAPRARGVMKDGRRFGRPPTPYTPPATPEGKVNISDPDSRNVKTPRGYMQGYNAQARLQREPDRRRHRDQHRLAGLRPPRADGLDRRTGVGRRRHRRAAGGGRRRRRLLARRPNRRRSRNPDPGPADAGKRRGARPGWEGGRYAFMRRGLETDLGKQLYGKRQATIEPVFANTKFNRRSTASYAAADPPAGRNGT